MTSAKLFILGEERELLWTSTNYNRHISWNGSPTSEIMGGLLTLCFVSQENDDVFWHNLLKNIDRETERMEKGEIHFYSKGEDYSPIKKYIFNDAYIVYFSEIFDAESSQNMQTVITISPAIQNYGTSRDFVQYWQISQILDREPFYYRPQEEKEDRIIYINGHFYNKDGTFEGKINEPDYEGSVNDVYVCDGKSTQKDKNENERLTYNNAKKLEITHEQFCYIGGVIKAEDSSNFQVAAATTQATFNTVKFEKGNDLTMSKQSEYSRKLLSLNTYSTATIKTALIDNEKELNKEVLNARKGLIHVLLSKEDLSEGALLWDGIDFANEGVKHNKATKDEGISITKMIWNQFVETCIFKKYKKEFNDDELRLAYGKHQTKKEVLENIPFGAEKEIYETVGTSKFNKGRTLYLATVVRGRQVFWKPYKEHENNKGYNWKYFMDHNL